MPLDRNDKCLDSSQFDIAALYDELGDENVPYLPDKDRQRVLTNDKLFLETVPTSLLTTVSFGV